MNLCPRAVPRVLNPSISILSTQSTPRGRLSTQGTARGHRFTWLPPMAFALIVILSKFLGLAEDVALGLLSENPSDLQSIPRGRLITLGTALGHRFTWLPPQLFHRLSHSKPSFLPSHMWTGVTAEWWWRAGLYWFLARIWDYTGFHRIHKTTTSAIRIQKQPNSERSFDFTYKSNLQLHLIL